MVRIFILENSQAALVQTDALSLSPSPWDTLGIQNHSGVLEASGFQTGFSYLGDDALKTIL